MKFELRRKIDILTERKPSCCFWEKYFNETFGYAKVGFWGHFWIDNDNVS